MGAVFKECPPAASGSFIPVRSPFLRRNRYSPDQLPGQGCGLLPGAKKKGPRQGSPSHLAAMPPYAEGAQPTIHMVRIPSPRQTTLMMPPANMMSRLRR